MNAGRLIAVVGPSGVGKDSLISALCACRPGLLRARRVITRDPAAGGEPFEAVTEQEFLARAVGGGFALSWQAHGLHYGIPVSVDGPLARGEDVVANLSRGAVTGAAARFDRVHVLWVTADPAALARRLAGRGRESGAEIAGRLARAAPPVPADLPPGVALTRIDNSGALKDSVAAALKALYPEGGVSA